MQRDLEGTRLNEDMLWVRLIRRGAIAEVPIVARVRYRGEIGERQGVPIRKVAEVGAALASDKQASKSAEQGENGARFHRFRLIR